MGLLADLRHLVLVQQGDDRGTRVTHGQSPVIPASPGTKSGAVDPAGQSRYDMQSRPGDHLGTQAHTGGLRDAGEARNQPVEALEECPVRSVGSQEGRDDHLVAGPYVTDDRDGIRFGFPGQIAGDEPRGGQ